MSSSDDTSTGALDLATLARKYADGALTPTELMRTVRRQIDRNAGANTAGNVGAGADADADAGPGAGVWISLTPAEDLEAAAQAVEARRRNGETLALYGVPFAVKDNIDVAGLPTTAACPAFAYTPTVSAAAVSRLTAAGAIVIGKTNLDQFASGLVGVRSPYGFPRNPFNRDFVPGGSSSGSAVAVAIGQVSFALGTDTAGSGRVPAGYNNIVGLKPSRGVISTTGVVPACRSLDCVSVFAATCEDAARVAQVMRGFDATDPGARPAAESVGFTPEPFFPVAVGARGFRFAVPATAAREFCGDALAAAAFDESIRAAERLGGTPIEIDMAPFREAAALLYTGPFVAERLEAAGRLFAERPDALIPPLRAILADAGRHTAAAAFAAQARLQLLRRQVAELWRAVDCLWVPTAPTLPRIADVERDPLGVNASLGAYCNFVNLLDLAALAVPAGFRGDGLPAGITLVGPWGSDARLAGIGTRLHRATSARIGATAWPLPAAATTATATTTTTTATTTATSREGAPESTFEHQVEIAVVGAHLSGEPLNHQLTSIGGKLVGTYRTKPLYRLFALPNTTPPKPGLMRATDGNGAAIEVEIWALPSPAFGGFVARIPAPLCIGKLDLDDGESHAKGVCGFLCEPHATIGARDISSFGGWRAYLRQNHSQNPKQDPSKI